MLNLSHIFIQGYVLLFIDTQFRMSILERLEQMEQRMAEITNQNPSSETSATKSGSREGGGGASDQQSQVNVNKVPVRAGLNFGFSMIYHRLSLDSKQNVTTLLISTVS